MVNFFREKYKLIKQKKFYSKLISKNDLCFDIGANTGEKSKVFLSLHSKVIAFEPQSICIEELSKIKHKNFQFHPFAVGSVNELKELQLGNHVEVATFSKKMIDFYSTNDIKWNRSEKVKVKKLDTLIGEFGLPNFCKIDTEGFELEILSSLTKDIPIIEFEFVEAFVEDTIEIINVLKNKYSLFNYNLNEKPKFELETWVNPKEMIDVIVKLPKRKLHGNIFAKIDE